MWFIGFLGFLTWEQKGVRADMEPKFGALGALAALASTPVGIRSSSTVPSRNHDKACVGAGRTGCMDVVNANISAEGYHESHQCVIPITRNLSLKRHHKISGRSRCWMAGRIGGSLVCTSVKLAGLALYMTRVETKRGGIRYDRVVGGRQPSGAWLAGQMSDRRERGRA